MSKLFLCLMMFMSMAQISYAKNMVVIDGNTSELKEPAFTVVRTGKPTFSDFQKMCSYGVRRMIVLAGNGAIEEEFAKRPWSLENCKDFKVIYNRKQSTKIPLSKEFLENFDEEILKAKQLNYGVGFRCNCGCHRTGRLAAYYNMKYKGMSVSESVKDQRQNAPGLATFVHRRKVKRQIEALDDYINGRECKDEQYCVIENDISGDVAGSSEDDDIESLIHD